jgi:hypothetical protein
MANIKVTGRNGKFYAYRDGISMGAFLTKDQATLAANTVGVDEPKPGVYRVRKSGKYIGSFKTRAEAVKARMQADTAAKVGQYRK